ncbi:MAG TPA: ArdC-like ssDNA-binding domain-containing protein [Acidobacteriaceae bacterium]|nr:ArdC-like ssDNA-binding domain-containing protein [Acidobacteriaceae bacterium]
MSSVNTSTATLRSNSSIATPQRKNAAQPFERSESPYQQRTNPKDNPTQQAIKQAVDFLIEQLQQGKSEMLTAYLTAMAQFHSYSFGNILLIARQRPTACRVAGIRTWNELGRYVRKGEKGIQILAPMMGFRRRKDDGTDEDAATQRQQVLIGFRAVYVFDVSQTEGAELPEMNHTVTGEVGEHRDRLFDFIRQQNITLEYNEKIAPALGISYGGKIVLLPGQSKAEEFTTLVHELAHEILHKAERRILTTQTVRETEAEAVAFVVGKAVGIEVGNAASDYIQLYHGNAELLAESLEIVQRTASVILAAIQPEESVSQEAAQEPAPEPKRARRSRAVTVTTEAA